MKTKSTKVMCLDRASVATTIDEEVPKDDERRLIL